MIGAPAWQELAWQLVATRPGSDAAEWLHIAFRQLSLADQLRCMREVKLCRAAKRGEVTAEIDRCESN